MSAVSIEPTPVRAATREDAAQLARVLAASFDTCPAWRGTCRPTLREPELELPGGSSPVWREPVTSIQRSGQWPPTTA